MDASYAYNGFLGGEISAFAQGRWDRPDYKVSLAVCYNAFPVEIGPWVRRPGTAFAGTTRGGNPGRAMSWAFEQASAVTLEFTDGWLRFRDGLTWLDTDDTQAVTSISAADPAAATVPSAWPTGSTVIFGNLGTSCSLLQNRQFTISNIGGNAFTLQDALTGANIDGSTLGAVAAGATVSRIQEIATPYVGGAWSSATLRMVQAETVGILLNGTVAPQALTVPTLPGAGTDAQFALAAALFSDGPYLDPFTNGAQVTANQTTGVVSLTLSFPPYVATTSYATGDFVTSSSVNYESLVDQNIGNTPASSPTKWAPVDAGAAINPPPGQPNGTGRGFLQTDVGRLVRLFSEPALWLVGSTYAEADVVAYNPTNQPGASTYWQSLTSSNTGNVPGADLTNWEVVAPGATLPTLPDGTQSINAAAGPAQWTWGKIVSLANFIPGAPSGIAHIGTMTSGGGLAAAFNGNTDQSAAASAQFDASAAGAASLTATGYVGQNYGGCSPASYKIASASIFPSSDQGFYFQTLSKGFGGQTAATITLIFSLYGSNSAPTGPTNGTLLGTTTLQTQGTYGTGSNTYFTSPVTVTSSDQATNYAYLWYTLNASFQAQSAFESIAFNLNVAQVEFVAAGGTGATANGINVELLGPELLSTTAIRTWQLGAYSNTTGWPTCGCYADGRLWLGGAAPNRFDACYSNGINGAEINFAPTDQYGNVTDANGISYTLNSDSVNPIQWMLPNQQGIILGTQQREWLLFAPGAGGMTPTNIDSRPVTHIGGANVLPVFTEHTNIFVQRYSLKLMEYFADIFSGKFTAPNLADKAQHITRAGIEEIAYVQATAPMLWGRCADGSLFGMSYKRDTLMTSSGPTYYAWHRHGLGSARVVTGITSGPNVGGDLDAITIVTNQTNATDPQAGVYHVEVMTDTLDEVATLAQYWLLDDAVVPSSATNIIYPAWAIGTTYAAGQAVTYGGSTWVSLVAGNVGNTPGVGPGYWVQAPYGGLTLNGLWHLNGELVTVAAGGLDCGDYYVVNGSLFVPYGDGVSAGTGGGQFTATYAATNPQIIVGFTYNSDGQLVRPMTPQDTGARNGPALGKKRRVQQAAALLSTAGAGNSGNQLAISFGTNFAKLRPAIINYNSTSGKVGSIAPLQSFSGVWFDAIGDESSFDGMVCWRISRPAPANIVAIEPFLHSQDK